MGVVEIEDPPVCTECGSRDIDKDNVRGEVVCADCGMVLTVLCLSDDGLEREPSRDNNLCTEISISNRDHQGRRLTLENQARAVRLRLWQRRMRSYKAAHRNAHMAFRHLDRTCEIMDLPVAVKEASHRLYQEALRTGHTLGRPMDVMTAAIVYSACRLNGIPRTLNEVSGSTGIDRRLIGRMHVRLVRELDLRMPLPRPDDFVARFCSALKLSEDTTRKALEIVRAASDSGTVSGKDPSGTAAAAIYLATTITGQTRTQGEVEEHTGITQVTIRKRCRELHAIRGSA